MNLYLKFAFFQNLFKNIKFIQKFNLKLLNSLEICKKYAFKIEKCNLHIKYALILEICKNMHL